jgi:Domain of unknown function (DUF4440)
MTNNETEALVLTLEERMWEANRKGDGEFNRECLADEAVVVSLYGVLGKEAIVHQVAENRVPFTSTRLDHPRVVLLTDRSALVTYNVHIEAVRNGQPFAFSVYATSAWKRVGERCLGVLHHQTPVQQS